MTERSAVTRPPNTVTWRPQARSAGLPAQATPGAPRRTLLGYLAMPRPKDLFKALLMPLTFALAVLATDGTDTRTLLRAAVVLVALEFLIYPARYQWNDVRGFAADQRHPDEADRGRLPGPLDRGRAHVTASCAVAVGRIALTAALPLLLPGLHLGGLLLFVVVGVLGVAAAYEALRAAATGRGGAVPPPIRPAIALLWITVGAGYVVRGLTGLAVVVDLPRQPGLGGAAALTLWAYGIAFVTSRWAIESTAFARLRDGQVEWVASAGQAREHLLALARWLPTHADVQATSAKDWAAVRTRTPVLAPWNVAMIVAGGSAAVTGLLLTAPASPGATAVAMTTGALAALAAVVAGRGRGVAVALGAVALVAVLMTQDTTAPVLAALPWLALMSAYLRFSGQCLRTMGAAGERLRAGLRSALAPAGRLLIGRETWNALQGGPVRG